MRTSSALASLVFMAVLAAGGPAGAQPASGAAPPVDVTGATYAELDEATGLWTLRGSPVTVRRGAITVQAPSIMYDTRAQIVRAMGGASYIDATLALEASQITAWIQEDRLLAEDRVVAVQPEQNGRITAGRLEVFGKEQRLLATGSPVASFPDGTLSGQRIEAFASRDEVIADGTARIVHDDIDGIAPRIVLRRRDGTAVLSGGAVVHQGRNEARAETITADLRRRRITAAGQASITVYPDR